MKHPNTWIVSLQQGDRNLVLELVDLIGRHENTKPKGAVVIRRALAHYRTSLRRIHARREGKKDEE